MKEAILATDLAYYFKIRAKLTPVVIEDEFDWSINYHRHMIKSIMMTVCDLSGQCKPFDVAKKITEDLYSKWERKDTMLFKQGVTFNYFIYNVTNVIFLQCRGNFSR